MMVLSVYKRADYIFYVSGIELRACHAFSYLLSQIIIPILQMGKLTLRDIKFLAPGCVGGNWHKIPCQVYALSHNTQCLNCT